MCRFKSGIILKDRVFIPEYDSHQKMLDELGIDDNSQNAERLFIRAELVPKGIDVFSDINDWKFVVDQDILPDWYVEDYDKQRMIEAVKEWAKNHIHIGVDNLEITSGDGHYIKDCKNVVISGNAIVNRICGNATVNCIYDNAIVNCIYSNAIVERIYGNAKVSDISGYAKVKCIYGNATIRCIHDNATAEDISDNATVETIRGRATIKYICDNATIKTAKGQSTIITSPCIDFKNKDKLILLENATLKDCYNKVIYQSGDYKFVSVSGTGKLEES